jgi:hypothetical protein
MGIGIHIIGLLLERPIRWLRAALLPEAVERALRGANEVQESGRSSERERDEVLTVWSPAELQSERACDASTLEQSRSNPSARDNRDAATTRSSYRRLPKSELPR